jgi:hypothetical protein
VGKEERGRERRKWREGRGGLERKGKGKKEKSGKNEVQAFVDYYRQLDLPTPLL